MLDVEATDRAYFLALLRSLAFLILFLQIAEFRQVNEIGQITGVGNGAELQSGPPRLVIEDRSCTRFRFLKALPGVLGMTTTISLRRFALTGGGCSRKTWEAEESVCFSLRTVSLQHAINP